MSRWSDRSLRRMGWVIWLFGAVSVLLSVTVGFSATSSASSSWGTTGSFADLAFGLLAFSFPTVGLLIVQRQPANRIGWLLLVVGLAIALPNLFDAYAAYGLVIAPGTLPGPAVAAALNEGSWVWMVGTVGIFLILLFPDGRLPSPRWRWLPWLAGAAMVSVTVTITLGSATLTEGPIEGLANPILVEAWQQPLSVLLVATLPLLAGCIVAAAVALGLRFRRSRGLERLQLKWLAEAGALVAACYLAAMTGQFLKIDPFTSEDPPWLTLLQDLTLVSFALIPLAIGVAILRYRLYDVDRVINRTLVYGALTATLVATYLVSVLVFRFALDPLVGSSDLAVAASTLAVAAVFRPLRSRIQATVDRRFYRSRYDAARTVASFTGRLRQEVDLDAVSTDLRQVVREAMQPSHVSLWLRGTRSAP